MVQVVLQPAATRGWPTLREAPLPSGSSTRLELDSIAAQWQLALDAAQHALGAAGAILADGDLDGSARRLVHEREETAEELAHLARLTGVPPPWLSRVPVTSSMLGLPAGAKACLFDLDGVLTDSGKLHARAWSEVFDDLLLRNAERTGWRFVPFDPAVDYRAYVDGRSRLEGVHAFLASRGIRLPEGRPEDSARVDTAYGLARHKSEALERGLHERGVTALDGVRRYLEACGHAGVKRAAVSASARTREILLDAGLAALVDAYVDADAMRADSLRSLPAPDVLLHITRRLGVSPSDTVVLAHSPAGVAAGNAADCRVIGVGDVAQAELLQGFGAGTVVPSLASLLDRRLQALRPGDGSSASPVW